MRQTKLFCAFHSMQRAQMKIYLILHFHYRPPKFLDKVVGSSECVVLVGNGPLTSSVRPTKGRVVFERAWLSNGTQENFSSSVDSDVLPDVLPAYFDSTGCRLSSPVDVLVRLKIKTSGEGGSVSVEGETSGQFACLTRELRLWTFSPALRRGTPVESQVEVLLRFHSKEALPSDSVASQFLRKSASSSLTVVHLLQSEDYLDHWSIYYAGYCCTRTVRSRELCRERCDGRKLDSIGPQGSGNLPPNHPPIDHDC
jgi:hypothetical protein